MVVSPEVVVWRCSAALGGFRMPLVENSVDRPLDLPPLALEQFEHAQAGRAQSVEALLASTFLSPLADQEPLRLEPLQQRVERALLDAESLALQRLPQRVAVLLGAKLRERGE